jgi:DNA-binding LacI/PurR family transcriptional regulator
MKRLSLQPIQSPARRKQPAVIKALTDLAQQLGPGAKLPTARELSKALGITGATLTRCLEQLEGRGVLRCLQGSGIYVESGVLQKRIALVFGENFFPARSDNFGSLLLKQCAHRVSEHNEKFSFYLDAPAFHGVIDGTDVPIQQDLADALKQGKIDGIILVARSSVEQEVWLRSHGIPVVRISARINSLPLTNDVVLFDYQKLIELGVACLAEAGCKTVGLIGAMQEHGDLFRKALADQGLHTCDQWMVTDDASPSNIHGQVGREAAKQILSASNSRAGGLAQPDLPDGLLITDDGIAVGALDFFASRGVDIGGRLQIASHVNKGSFVLERWENKIFRLQFDPDKMASTLLNALESLMEGHPSSAPILIEPVLEEGNPTHFSQNQNQASKRQTPPPHGNKIHPS